MHSRIFQITRKPLVEDDYVTESLFHDEIFNHVADAVSEETNREEDINWLIGFLKDKPCTFNPAEKSIIFHPGFKEAYFKSDYEKFKNLTANMTLENFSTDGVESLDLYRIIKCINDKFSFYTVDDDYEVQTLDEFVRTVVKEDSKSKYFLGGTLDYHF